MILKNKHIGTTLYANIYFLHFWEEAWTKVPKINIQWMPSRFKFWCLNILANKLEEVVQIRLKLSRFDDVLSWKTIFWMHNLGSVLSKLILLRFDSLALMTSTGVYWLVGKRIPYEIKAEIREVLWKYGDFLFFGNRIRSWGTRQEEIEKETIHQKKNIVDGGKYTYWV